jgi:hypothetical protein
MDTITLGALESAEFVTRRTGRNAAQDRAGLAVRTARALYGVKRRTGGQCMRAGHLRPPLLDQAGAQHAAGHQLLTGDFLTLKIGLLVNIDHNTPFLIFRHRWSKGGACEVTKAFDPQVFLAKVGTGKRILKYRKGRIIYAQGEEADKIFYIQSGAVKVHIEHCAVFWRGMSEWSDSPHWNREGNGGVPYHLNNAEGAQ